MKEEKGEVTDSMEGPAYVAIFQITNGCDYMWLEVPCQGIIERCQALTSCRLVRIENQVPNLHDWVRRGNSMKHFGIREIFKANSNPRSISANCLY